MQSEQTTPPKRIWADPEAMDSFYEGFAVYSTPAGFSVQQGLWPEYILASEVAVLIAEAEARVMRIAAGLFPGGYSNNFARITEAVASSALIRAAKGEPT